MMKQARRKTGSFSSGGKVPKKDHEGGTLDWGALRRQREERLDREWDAGVRNPDTVRQRWLKSLSPGELKAEENRMNLGLLTPLGIGVDGEPFASGAPKISTPKSAAPKKATGRPRNTVKYDIDEIIRLYTEENLSPTQIKDKLAPTGPSYETIVSYLKKRDVFDPDRHRTGGRRPRESYQKQRNRYCPRNHDLDIPGNSRERVKKLPDGSTRPNGRECVICCRDRNRENGGKWENDARNPKNGGRYDPILKKHVRGDQ